MLYRNIEFDTAPGVKKNGIYVGKTKDFGVRLSGHTKNIANPPAAGGRAHYRLASHAEEHKMVVLSQFSLDTPDFALALSLTEHIWVSILDSWNPLVLNLPQSINEYCSKGRDSQTARFLSELARSTFTTTSWPVTTVENGCNWKTPISEGDPYDRVPWSSALVPDTLTLIRPGTEGPGQVPTRMRVFYRQPTRVRTKKSASGGDSNYVQLFLGSTFLDTDGLTIAMPSGVGIVPGTIVQLICEVMVDGTHHSHPWARLPSIGPFSGYNQLNSLGIRVLWKSTDGKYYSCPVQSYRHHYTTLDVTQNPRYQCLRETPFLTKTYMRASMLVDALMRVQYPSPLPDWKQNTRNLTIKNICYNHLEQNLEVTDLPTWNLTAPRLHTMEENWVALEQFARDHGNHAINLGPRPDGVFLGTTGGVRKLCDVCLIQGYKGNDLTQPDYQSTASQGHEPCTPIEVDGITTCWRCRILNRPCTWTKKDDIVPRGWQSLAVLPLFPMVPQEVSDPTSISRITEAAAVDFEEEDDSI